MIWLLDYMLACNSRSKRIMQRAVARHVKDSGCVSNSALCLYICGAMQCACLPKMGQHMMCFTKRADAGKGVHRRCHLWANTTKTDC